MNAKTEARNEIPGQGLTSSTDQAPEASPGKGEHRGLWVAIVALVAAAGLAAAVAIEAFDSSSDTEFAADASAIQLVDPRMDADFHREVAPAIVGLDSDYYRETNQHASKADATPGYVNSGLDADTQREINEQYSKAPATADPRLDADHHREASND